VENLGPREVIAEAVHLLSKEHGITEDAALDMLVRLSGDADATCARPPGAFVAAHVGP